MSSIHYDPDNWYTSLVRSLEDYVIDNLGTNLYDIKFEWPDTTMMTRDMPLSKTLIHFEVDHEDSPVIGFGDNVIDATTATGTITEREGACHVVNFDVGVWASVESGGPSARMEAREVLGRILQGPSARAACRAATDGVEIMSFQGGTNIIDSINDLTVWRMINMELIIRVYSRKTLGESTLVTDITQDEIVDVQGDDYLIIQNPSLIIP